MLAQRSTRVVSSVVCILSAAFASASVACSALTAPPPPEPLAAVVVTANLKDGNSKGEAPPARPEPTPEPKIVDQKPDPSLGIVDSKPGTGAAAKAGDTVSVHYRGTLKDGTEFDSSRPRGAPFTFRIGLGNVIKGWDQGIPGMKVGGTRKLTIPAPLAYGERAQSKIPANSTLIFEVELLEIKLAPAR